MHWRLTRRFATTTFSETQRLSKKLISTCCDSVSNGYSVSNDSIPDIFLTPASRIHNHTTRLVSNLNYFRPRVSTNLGRTSFTRNSPLQKSRRLYRLVSSVCHIISLRKNGISIFYKPTKSDLAYVFYHWYYLRFYSSLYCCRLFEHDGVQQESSCYFGHCTQMNLMFFS